MTSDGPTPKSTDAVAKFRAIPMVVHVDGQQPRKQFLTVVCVERGIVVSFTVAQRGKATEDTSADEAVQRRKSCGRL